MTPDQLARLAGIEARENAIVWTSRSQTDEALKDAEIRFLGAMRSDIPWLRALVKTLADERDEADRRAGAAERRMADLQEEASSRRQWLSKAKRQWGVPDAVSFDTVWAEALALRARLSTIEAGTLERVQAAARRVGASDVAEAIRALPLLTKETM